ncbi:MAG: YlmC/YmxH family sporulation protein [Clostridia bacterium]|nr:YlmC/YmxH family sporulation protein [Clostridia bacterium]
MELSFSDLKTKEVINTQDGKKLGKVCDVVLCYPENRWLGLVVPGGRSFGMRKNTVFIDLKRIVKIGEDVILVDIGLPKGSQGNKKCPSAPPVPPPAPHRGERNFDDFE